jgi:hypothetical protein
MLGPHAAATKVDEQAGMLRGLIDKARPHMSGIQWLCVTAAVRERVERYDSLANRLRELNWWSMRKDSQARP